MKLILGLGVTGLSVARFFNKNNISFRIADSRQSGEVPCRALYGAQAAVGC